MFNSGANRGFWRYQLRDKNGQFVEMGGAVTFEIQLPGVKGLSRGHGIFVGRDRQGFSKIQVKDAGGNIPLGVYEVDDKTIEAAKAIIPTADLPDGVGSKNGITPNTKNIKDIINRVKKEPSSGTVKDLVDGDVVQREDTEDLGVVSKVSHADDGTSSFDTEWVDGTKHSMELPSDKIIKIWKEESKTPANLAQDKESKFDADTWLADAKANYEDNRNLMNGDSNAPTEFVPGDTLYDQFEGEIKTVIPGPDPDKPSFGAKVENKKVTNQKLVNSNGRITTIVEINGVQVPFYISSGAGGKKDVEAGKWYPFFGIGSEQDWYNKASGKYINNYYGSPELRAQAEWLDANIGDVRNDKSIPWVGADQNSEFTRLINQDVHPVDNRKEGEAGAENLDALIKANIADVIRKIRMEPGYLQRKADEAKQRVHGNKKKQYSGDISELGINFQTATMDADGARLPTPGAFTGEFQNIMEGAKDWNEVAERLKGQTVTYFDFETTGISDYDGDGIKNDPIQLGAVQVKDGKIVKRFNLYMNPGSKLSKWSAENLKRDVVDENGKITGTTLVTPDWLETQMSQEEALQQFIDFIGPSALLGGQNVPFDLEILKRMAESNGIKLDIAGTIDSKDLASLLPKYDPEKGIDGPKAPDKKTGEMRATSSLGPVANFLGFEPANWHSADGDAEDSYNLVSRIIERAGKENNQDLSLLDFPAQAEKYREKMDAFKAAVSPDNPMTEKQKEAIEKFKDSPFTSVSIPVSYISSDSDMTRGEAAKLLTNVNYLNDKELASPDDEEVEIPEEGVDHTFGGKTFHFSKEEIEKAIHYVSSGAKGSLDVTDEEGKEFNARMRALTDYMHDNTVTVNETIPEQEKYMGFKIPVEELHHSAPNIRFDEILSNGIRPKITDKVGSENYSKRRFGVFIANGYTSGEAGKGADIFKINVPEDELRVDSGYTENGRNLYIERTIKPEEIEHLGHIPVVDDDVSALNDSNLHNGRGDECTICHPELLADKFENMGIEELFTKDNQEIKSFFEYYFSGKKFGGLTLVLDNSYKHLVSDQYGDDVDGMIFEGVIKNDLGDVVGRFKRQIYKNPDDNKSYNVHHEELTIKEEYRGKGFGTEFSKFSEDLYRSLGISEIYLTAGDTNGVYTWAKAGYQWDEVPIEIINNLKDLYKNGKSLHKEFTPAIENAIKDYFDRFSKYKFKDDEYPTPFELANTYIDGVNVGKYILRDGLTWEGHKKLSKTVDITEVTSVDIPKLDTSKLDISKLNDSIANKTDANAFWETNNLTASELKSSIVDDLTERVTAMEGLSIEEILDKYLSRTQAADSGALGIAPWDGTKNVADIRINLFAPDGSYRRTEPFYEWIPIDRDITYQEAIEKLSKVKSVDDLKLYLAGSPESNKELVKSSISKFIKSWASSSNDNNIEMLQMQNIVKDIFNLENTYDWPAAKYIPEIDVIPEFVKKLYSAFLRAQYDATQEMFKKRGIKEVVLYRGMEEVDIRNMNIEYGDIATVQGISRPLSSWSTDVGVAQSFASLEGTQDEDIASVVIRKTVKVEDIFSTALTGFGCLEELEFVVFGGTYDVEVSNTDAYIFMDMYNPGSIPEFRLPYAYKIAKKKALKNDN